MLVLEENNYLQAIDKRSSVVSSKIYNGGAFFLLHLMFCRKRMAQ